MAGKRKRADTTGEGASEKVNGDSSAKQQEQFHGWLTDVLVILRVQDTTPSTFDRPILSATQAMHDSKRPKLSESPESTTIASLIDIKAYTAIEQFIKDVDTATTSIAEDLKATPTGDQGRSVPQEIRAGIACTVALKKELDRLVQRELVQRPGTILMSKGIKDESVDEEDTRPRPDESGDNVLTLLAANTQPSKQLFTSIRKSTDSTQPLSELPLPNGITTTRITPLHSISEDRTKPVPTLKDLFAPPPSLPPLALPKQSRHTATRSSSVNWYNPAEVESKPKSGRRENYAAQPLTTGHWLKYSVAPNPTQLASPETKRKQRDRALSIGEPETPLSQEAMESHNQAKEDALFRSVYSSFAPDRDDSGALVSGQQKNKLWWNKYGEVRYHELLDMRDNEVSEPEMAEINGVHDDDILNEEELKEAIANFKPDDSLSELEQSKASEDGPSETSQDCEELLGEISDLLETLHSHQRIRNLPLAANTRPIAGQNPQSTALAGSPTSPSAAEFDVYEMLKSQLTLIVSNLPPYLLSKLDGDKLGALKISTNIQVESKNQKGSLEDSEAAASVRRAVAPSAAPVGASQNSSTYSNAPGRSNYLPTTTPAPQYPLTGYGSSTAPRPSASSSYLQNPQYSNRPASSNYASGNARPSYAPQGGYTPRPAAATSSSNYNYAQQYAQQPSQSPYGSYQNGYRPYSGQNASGYNYNSQYSTPQARAPSNPAQTSQAYRESQSEYQQRAVPPQGYGYGSAQAGGSASAQNQHRPSLSGQTPSGSTSQRPQLYHQHSSQYTPQTAGSPQINGTATSGSTSQQAHASADDQAAVLSKQKAQLGGQQSRQGSGTPQPPSRQYSPQPNGIQQNGTPVPQQNGIAVGPA